MIFTHDTETALVAAVELTNSALEPDTLGSISQLVTMLKRNEFSFDRPVTQDDLEEVRALRPQLRRLLLSERQEMANLVNTVLADQDVVPRLVKHDGHDWHMHYAANSATLAARIMLETAMALADVVSADAVTRLASCSDDRCNRLFLDVSRNRSKLYCSPNCGNRSAVAALRQRRATS